MLYAYGAFGESMLPAYQRDIRPWLDRGGIYAQAIVRGGGEYGREWHLSAIGRNRKKVYDDFLAASEHLVREGWTSPDRFVIRGGSAGGLLVTVAEVERPDLYRAVIAEVPVTDMVRYPLGHDNGTLWVEEYGSPAKADEFGLYQYSPYHRVKKGTKYPSTLILSSENDQRLDPMHSRKFAAALDDADPCATVLLRTEHDGGHAGASRQSNWIQEVADLYTFALNAVGITQ
jgi:prolyl oligopeptidase